MIIIKTIKSEDTYFAAAIKTTQKKQIKLPSPAENFANDDFIFLH